MKLKSVFAITASAVVLSFSSGCARDTSGDAQLLKENGFDIIGVQRNVLAGTCYTLKKSAESAVSPTHQACVGPNGLEKIEPLDYPKQ